MVAHLSPPDPERPPKYPFEQWMDGREWTIMRGRDYWGSTQMMQRSLMGSANARRVSLHIFSTWTDNFVRFRAKRSDPPEAV